MKKVFVITGAVLFGGLMVALAVADYKMKNRKYLTIHINN